MVNEAEVAKIELERYKFHWERFNNHHKSRNLCIKQLAKLKEPKGVIEVLHIEKKYPSSELEFFERAAKAIIDCRKVLQWTYCMLFMEHDTIKEHEKGLLNFQLEELETACERAHKFFESD